MIGLREKDQEMKNVFEKKGSKEAEKGYVQN
jgi:hypothetical protein